MSRSVLVLGLVCIALAALDVKLLRDLRADRAGPEMAADLPVGAASAEVAAGTGAATPGLASLRDRGGKSARKSDAELQREADADFLRMYADPRLRQQLVAEFAMEERNRMLGVEITLDIPIDRWDMLSQRLAELNIEAHSLKMRCAADSSCAPDHVDLELFKKREQAAQEVLGAVKADELAAYRRTQRERAAVETLQARLGDSQLSRERAEELITALYDESMLVSNEWMKKDSPTMRMHYVGFPRVGSAAYPSSANTSELQLAAVREHSERMRQRAAPLLNAEQRAAFDAMQLELLKRFEGEQRRRAAGG